MSGRMTIDLHQVPFSSFGSFLCLHHLPASWKRPGLIMRSVRSGGTVRELSVVKLMRDGVEVPSRASATPACLALRAVDGSACARFAFAGPDQLHFEASGADLVFESTAGQRQVGFSRPDGSFTVNAPATAMQLLFSARRGALVPRFYHQVRTQEDRSRECLPKDSWVVVTYPSCPEGAEGCIEGFETAPRRSTEDLAFSRANDRAERAWCEWLLQAPKVDEAYREGAELAAFVNYTSAIRPTRTTAIRRPTVLMSKNWMTSCWSWDHCFNAVALSYRQHALAWDQFLVPFDYQGEDGSLPDSVSAGDVGINFCKPPIHGWALGRMMEVPGFLTEERARTALPLLEKWTDWWFEHRDSDGDGLPEYHHGNDSGWDNATIFDLGLPVAGPDLAAYLAVQLQTLARLSAFLGRKRESAGFEHRARETVDRMLRHLWTGEEFRALLVGPRTLVSCGDSLIPFLALLAGELLPTACRAEVVRRFQQPGRFLTGSGAATESPLSPLYVPDGYWRGPVWPSSTVLMAEGLLRSGAPELAHQLARAFCDNCARTMCFAENYHAIEGTPLRDTAYTWASSAYLFFAHEYLFRPTSVEAGDLAGT